MSILAAVVETLVSIPIETVVREWTDRTQDYRSDRIYKAKLEGLIERNRQFEDERDRANCSGSRPK